MTAVAAPPSFPNLNRPGWINGGPGLNSINSDDRGATMFAPRKTMQRSNSSSSIASNSSTSSASTVTSTISSTNGKAMPASGDLGGWTNGVPRKRPQPKGQWTGGKAEGPGDFQRPPAGRPMLNGVNGPSTIHPPNPMLQTPNQVLPQNGMSRPNTENMAPGRQPVLYLTSLNGTFERKTISVPYYPETLRIGRQTNQKTVPTPQNGFFDSKVLSRQHAEIWADPSGKIFIRDVKSSNGTFVNNTRLSQENRESEPHELQANDRLELGIDIVSEDQKTVVHHKVAAKVEHAGFLAPSNSLLDMSFGDLDPSLGGMMMPVAGVPARGRYGGNMMIPQLNGRVMPANIVAPTPNGMGQRQFWLHPPTVDNIVKRLHSEMRNARLQSQDLRRTQEFVDALLSHEDVKAQEKLEAPEAPKNSAVIGNIGNAVSFRSDGGKTRFSDPPAPPPSQPLPEKPDVAKSASDVPSLKRGTTERPRSNPPSASPSRQDQSSLQLMEMLTTARREAETHSARVRDLEEMLIKEREARLFAEDMIQKMEDSSHSKVNGTAIPPLTNPVSELDKAFDPPAERPLTPEPDSVQEDPEDSPLQPDKVEASAASFQARLDSMLTEMRGLRDQLELYKQRAEQAEAERDTDRKTLAELVKEIHRRDEEERKRAERKARSPSKGQSRPSSRGNPAPESAVTANGSATTEAEQSDGSSDEPTIEADGRSRSDTIRPFTGALTKTPQDPVMLTALPYTSMIGVVLIGMGLMAYLNAWQPQPRLDR